MRPIVPFFLAIMTFSSSALASDRLNTEFDKSGMQKIVVMNDAPIAKTVYARFSLPNDPNNRNNGFVQTIPPKSEIVYNLPAGTSVFACDGKYWDDYTPKEKLMGVLEENQTLRWTAFEFQP